MFHHHAPLTCNLADLVTGADMALYGAVNSTTIVKACRTGFVSYFNVGGIYTNA
jgi:hypothetical protein